MSKAFTRESDFELESRPLPRRPLSARENNPITAAGAQRFEAELVQLIERRRGTDLSAPETVSLQTRIRQLQEILQSAVIAVLPADRTRIAFGANVQIRYANGEQAWLQIVGVDESDPEHDKISWQSPLARELMGRQVGEEFRFRAPAGDQKLQILAVSYPATT